MISLDSSDDFTLGRAPKHVVEMGIFLMETNTCEAYMGLAWFVASC